MNIKRGILSGLGFGVAFVIGAVAAAIINPLPYIFQNGSVADAGQVNADFAQIVANVNANAQAIATAFSLPTHSDVVFHLGSCPTGWILADGTAGTVNLNGILPVGSGSRWCEKT